MLSTTLGPGGHLEVMACMALKVVLEARAILVLKGHPGPQEATMELTLWVALWVRVAMADHSTMKPMPRELWLSLATGQ